MGCCLSSKKQNYLKFNFKKKKNFSEYRDISFYSIPGFNLIKKQISEIFSDSKNYDNHKDFLEKTRKDFNSHINILKSGLENEQLFKDKNLFHNGYDNIENIYKNINLPLINRFFIIEIQKCFINPETLNEKSFKNCYIEVKILDKDKIEQKIFKTTLINEDVNPTWFEVFKYNFYCLEDSEIFKSLFKISLFCDYELIGSVNFQFSELKNQLLIEKVVLLKNPDFKQCFAEIFIKCQLVYDMNELITFWVNNLESINEVISKMINCNNNHELLSLNSKDNSIINDSGTFSNYFVLE